ncbi:hypothetical protein MVEN_02599400 [Mycena venus]|uniref:DUF7330 domain-containing protein n=1 Tax=Mycena venus TaxID=2733690 RepID=A0A8H6WR30_9AGAR|nr:hypothetical protein MVEN_02599400 [Mycena venus]
MIVPQDTPKSALLQSEAPNTSRGEATVTDVAPPAYEPPSSIAPPNIQPANYISLTPHFGEAKGTFVLDPTLLLPHSMRPRSNKMHLSISTVMGEANAVVYVVGSESLPSGSKTRMEVSSRMGTTKLVVHAPERRAPISVSINNRLGEATLLLPRSFRGPLRLSNTLGEITLSKALRAATVSFGDRMFVGQWRDEELKEKVWPGDEAVVDSALGSIFVGYSDELKKACVS